MRLTACTILFLALVGCDKQPNEDYSLDGHIVMFSKDLKAGEQPTIHDFFARAPMIGQDADALGSIHPNEVPQYEGRTLAADVKREDVVREDLFEPSGP